MALPSYDQVMSGSALPSYDEVMGGQAGGPALSQMKFTSDKDVPSATEAFFRAARGGVGAELAEEASSRVIGAVAKRPGLMLGSEPSVEDINALTEQASANGPITKAAAEGIRRVQAGEDYHPTADILGSITGTIAQTAATEGLPITEGVGIAAKKATPLLKGSTAALGGVADLFGGWADRLSRGIVKLSDAAEKRLGQDGVQEMFQYLRDKGITNTVQTLRKIGSKMSGLRAAVGDELGAAFSEISNKAATLLHTDLRDMLPAAVQQGSRDIIPASDKAAVQAMYDDFMKSAIAEGRINPDAVSLEDGWTLAKSIETASGRWAKADPNKATVANLTADALRDITQYRAQQASPALADRIIDTSHEYSLAKAADNGIQARIRQAGKGMLVRSGVGAAVGGTVGYEVGGGKGAIAGAAIGGAAGASAPAVGAMIKLTGGMQEAADYAAKILSQSQKLGKYYPVLVRALRAGGLATVASRHAHLMMADPQYRKIVNGLEIQ